MPDPNKEWFFGSAADKNGPVRETALIAMARSGKLPPTTLVWTEGMPHWLPAGRVPLLYPPGTLAAPAPDGAMHLLLPTGPQSGWALAAGYLGLFSLLPMLSLVTGPLAITFGVLALREVKAHPERRGTGRAITGIVGGSIGVLVSIALWIIL